MLLVNKKGNFLLKEVWRVNEREVSERVTVIGLLTKLKKQVLSKRGMQSEKTDK